MDEQCYEVHMDVDAGHVTSVLGAGATLADALKQAELMQETAYHLGAKRGRDGRPVYPTTTITIKPQGR